MNETGRDARGSDRSGNPRAGTAIDKRPGGIDTGVTEVLAKLANRDAKNKGDVCALNHPLGRRPQANNLGST